MLNTSAIEGMRRFLKHAETLKPRNNPRRENGFAKEFQEIKELTSRLKKDPSYSTKHGEKDVNRPKNRYKDILPYDYTRIILPISQGVDGSDYINGNYIKGPTEEVLYLAAQGPLPQTVNDFWRMIISHRTQVIVMACREYELGKLKCKRYWPESIDEKLTFDGCEVSLISQEEMGDGFIIRTLSAKHAKGELKVTQFHYTAWPDHDVPRSATPLIELTMSFRAFVGNDNKVPVLAHCSAGCGRTGTICALDFAMSLIKLGRTDNFSVFDIVSELRKQRIAMVQTKEQYELVYKAVKEIVSNELLKQRSSMHTYVNVAVGEEPPPIEQTYENVEFIRSIQRLHEEEKNASRRPKDLPSSTHKAIVVAPNKDVVLAPEKKGFPPQNRAKISANHRQEKISANQRQGQLSANQNQESARKGSKENVVQSSPKPPIKKKPASGYENVLPLSVANASSKPPVVPKPQNYVNVFVGDASSDNEDNDYVNIPSKVTKAVPVPEKTSEALDKTTKLVPVPPTVKPVPPHPGNQQMSSSNAKDNGDYVIPPLPKKTEKSRDCVIPPKFAANANIQQIPEGNLIDLCDSGPSSLPLRRASSEIEVQSDRAKMVKQRSLDSMFSTDLSRSTPALQSKDSDTIHHLPTHKKASTEKKQAKTTQPLSGQYSLVGAFEEPRSPTLQDNRNPFENVGHTDKKENIPPKERSSFSLVESVVPDSAPVKLEKPVVVPRRESEGSPRRILDQPFPQGNPIIGIYSVVNIPNSEKTPDKKDEPNLTVEPEKESPSSGRSTPILPNRLVQKAYSTENISSNKADLFSSLGQSKGASTEAITKPSLGSNLSDYSLVTVAYMKSISDDVLESGPTSTLYSSAGGYMPKKATGVSARVSENAVQSGPTPELPDRYKPMKAADVSASTEKRESGDVLGSGPTSSLYSSAGGYMPKKATGVSALASENAVQSGPTPELPERYKPMKTADVSASTEKRESGDVLGSGPTSSLYSSANSYMPKKPLGLKRSHSGVTPPIAPIAADLSVKVDVDSLYATVGAKTKDRKRSPIGIWSSNGYSPSSSLEREMNRSSNSSSSLRSINSTSSNDSLEDTPPIPLKTADAFSLPGDDDAYEAVQKSSKSTLDRFKSKAKNMISSGPHVHISKLSLGKKMASPHIASSDSLASGEGPDFDASDKGYGSRVGKPVGARQCPSHWPKFAR